MIERRFAEAKIRLIEEAKQSKQWRTVIQSVMTVLAAGSIMMVWKKIHQVESRKF